MLVSAYLDTEKYKFDSGKEYTWYSIESVGDDGIGVSVSHYDYETTVAAFKKYCAQVISTPDLNLTADDIEINFIKKHK